MIRALSMAGGLAGAVALSQFPEFSQQYLQRLAGAVDELRGVVVTFDRAAARAGMSREEALADLDRSAFQDDLQQALRGQILRYEALSSDYAALRRAEPLGRLVYLARFADPELARRTWDDYRPAVPASADGAFFAGIGFAGGWLSLALLFAALRRMWRRAFRPVAEVGTPRRPAPPPRRDGAAKAEPPLSRPHPRLSGVTRGPAAARRTGDA